MPDYAIIITVRNGSIHLPAAIQSVRWQSLPRWELIVFDDGSSDASAEVAEAALEGDARGRVIRSPAVGRGAALNAAIASARAERIVILDCDDLLHPDLLELQRQQDRPADITGCNTFLLLENEAAQWRAPAGGIGREVTSRLSIENPLAHSGVCYRRALWQQVGGYRTNQAGALDYRFYVDAAAKGARLFKIPAILVAKRIHQAQSFERRNRVRYLKAGLQTQLAAIQGQGGGVGCTLLAYLRFAYGLLPRWVRHMRYRKS